MEQLGVIRGPVTCLWVTGNVAVIKFSVGGGPSPVILELTVEDVPTGDLISVGDGLGDPTDCSEPGGTTRRVVTGNVTVIDARPLPTASSDCKHNGWKNYGVFKNQGDCVSLVASGGKNPPGKP